MTTYAVTGATGQFGHLAVLDLLARAVPVPDVVAVVRTAAKAADLAERGVQVREADYTDPQALVAALDGVDRLLLVSGSEAGQRLVQHRNVIDAANASGVGRIVYTSILDAQDSTNPLAGEHRDTEQYLHASGVPATIARNSWYTENYTGQLAQYLSSGEILGAAGDGRISAATRADYATAAVTALVQEDAGQTYELGGPSFDLTELARAVCDATGSQVGYRNLSVEEYVAALRSTGMDEGTAQFVAAIDASIADGGLETDSGDLERLLGRPATPMQDVVAAAAAGLRSS